MDTVRLAQLISSPPMAVPEVLWSARRINVQTVTDGISRRVTSGRENTSFTLADHGVKVIAGYYRNVMFL